MSKEINPEKLPSGQSYFDILLLGLSVIVLILAYQISGLAICEPGTFPLASAFVMVVSLAAIVLGNRKEKREKNRFAVEIKKALHRVCTRTFLIYTVITILYIIAIQPFHFLPSSLLFLIVSIVFLRGSKPLNAVLISVGMLGFIYVVFLYFFKVILP